MRLQLLSDFFTPNVKVSPVDNMIVITGTQSVIDRVKADIAKIDRPSPGANGSPGA